MKQKFVASVSFGKDSLASILLAKEHGEPLDEAVYCEVMFDRDISGEVPEHRDFIYGAAIPALERMGVKVVVLRSVQTYRGAVHRADHPGTEERHGALFPSVRQVRCPAGFRRRKLHILRPAASGRAHSFRCGSSPPKA